MPTTYSPAPPEILTLLESVRDEHHQELTLAGVTIECQTARAARDKDGLPKGPALKHHGWPAAAIVKIINVKDRVAGCCDARITVDEDRWEELSETGREALLSHELTHLQIRHDKEGNIALDEANRPKLKMRPHDKQLGIFTDIVKRYGIESVDAQVCVDLGRAMVQQEFDFEGLIRQEDARRGTVPMGRTAASEVPDSVSFTGEQMEAAGRAGAKMRKAAGG